MTDFACPVCTTGKLRVVVQVIGAITEDGFKAELPTTDDFVSAYCTSDSCPWELNAAGDGRLRKADLLCDEEVDLSHDNLRTMMSEAVERIIDDQWPKPPEPQHVHGPLDPCNVMCPGHPNSVKR